MAIPKYQYIKDELKNKIISGQFASGDKFYTEAELIAMYDVSSITVVRALNDLAKDGYIVRQQGKGTFVSRARKHKLVEFSDVEIFETKDDKVTVLSIERGNKLEYLDKLGLRGDQFYYKIERIRQTNDVTYIYHTSYIPEQYINANYPNLDYYSSIYTRFKLDYRIHMSDEHFEEINEIAFPTPEHAASVFIIARERSCENTMKGSYLISSIFTKNKLNTCFVFPSIFIFYWQFSPKSYVFLHLL
ncbi:GntR family transcriptional regulator [Streptococcus oralis]|uniref:GntR family transcriptional regulator n=1 Tax=Streptococcus oralis TaxID=1303 RepID=UPI00267EF8D2|nr:GntR family transcriptional regulator [Streptococcus oralis]